MTILSQNLKVVTSYYVLISREGLGRDEGVHLNLFSIHIDFEPLNTRLEADSVINGFKMYLRFQVQFLDTLFIFSVPS